MAVEAIDALLRGAGILPDLAAEYAVTFVNAGVTSVRKVQEEAALSTNDDRAEFDRKARRLSDRKKLRTVVEKTTEDALLQQHVVQPAELRG